MKKIATLPYEDVKFVWVASHYDFHLKGLCEMGRTLFWFETQIEGDYEKVTCDIYMLSFWDEIKLRFRKFRFEQMVGYHWTYPNRKNKGFYYRKPVWLYKFLFKLHYSLKRIK